MKKKKLSSAAALILGGIALVDQVKTSPQVAEIMQFINQANFLDLALVGAAVYLLWRDNPDG